MAYDWLDEYLRGKPGAEHDYKLEWEWDRYMVRGRMFAAICCPGSRHKAYAGHRLVNLKCDPMLAEAFREAYPEVRPGFYMDKRNWNAVLLDGSLPEETLRDLCDLAYRLILEKLPQRVQREIVGAEQTDRKRGNDR